MPKFDTKLDRYPFSAIPTRPAYDWPNGTRLAVYFAINIEAFEFGRSPGNDFTSMPTPPFHRGYAYRDYGNRVGVWRILREFERRTAFIALARPISRRDFLVGKYLGVAGVILLNYLLLAGSIVATLRLASAGGGLLGATLFQALALLAVVTGVGFAALAVAPMLLVPLATAVPVPVTM